MKTNTQKPKTPVMAAIELLRPLHWSKNVFVFAALIWSHKLSTSDAVGALVLSIAGFMCFCFASSATYILNDILDRRADRLHPVKSTRPIASGAISVNQAFALFLICCILAIGGSFFLGNKFGIVIVCYMILTSLYSLVLKRVMILDCIIISMGFVLRAIGGVVLLEVEFSHWLMICTFTLCLFLAFGKRRAEISRLAEGSVAFRETLRDYSPELLSHMLNVTSSLAIVSFMLYANAESTIKRFGNNYLLYTTPAVLYCIFRFTALVQQGKVTGPVDVIMKDRPFQIGLFVWLAASVYIIYGMNYAMGAGV
ncbi:MAG: decaprenyl-phosphate phosphoribosyltransferase [Phycisphaerae bacterium]|nr:decaprenyl-phosphate phosphoribosyltransferase [Phycisphaerae bacterium]